jgi:dephospho-CoA kinase
MLKIGLTGGIGSGKSTVAKIFELLGIPVYYADDRAKELMNTDPYLRTKIIEHFGEAAYSGNILNRSYIASIVFNNKEKLQLLNSFVHPVTIADSESWMRAQSTPYAVREAALIFESKVNLQLDYVIGVSAPQLLRIQRLTERDPVTPEEIEKRMSNQMDEDEKMALCDFVIVNDETEPVIPQVIELHEKFLSIAAEKTTQ